MLVPNSRTLTLDSRTRVPRRRTSGADYWVDSEFSRSARQVSGKRVDGCWEYTERVDLGRLDPVFLAESRAPMNERYGVELFPAFVIEAGSGLLSLHDLRVAPIRYRIAAHMTIESFARLWSRGGLSSGAAEFYVL
jgi:hypothetical protein